MSETVSESTPRATREPGRRLSEDEKAKIRETMIRDDVRGNLALVAELLGLNYGQVESFVRRDPHLAASAPGKDAAAMVPSEADIIDRKGLPQDGVFILNQKEFDEYQSLIRQTRIMLAKDWQASGMTEEQGAKLEGYSRMGASPIGQVIRASHGMLIKNMMHLDDIIEKDVKMVKDGTIPAELKADGTPRNPQTVDREWRQTIHAGMRIQLETFVHMNRLQAMMAQAAKNLAAAQLKGSQIPKGKLAASTQAPKNHVGSANAEA